MRTMRNATWLLICLILFVGCNHGSDTEQNPADHTHALAAGLSNNNIYDIEQDSCGQLWFATFRGLNRYDSRDFHHYFADHTDSLSLPHDQIRDLIVDQNGRLWIGTVNGLCRYTDDDNFARHPRLDQGLVYQMEHGPDSTIIIRINNSVKVLHPGTDAVETLFEELQFENVFSPKLLVDPLETIWIVANPYLLKYDFAKRCVADSIPLPSAMVKNAFMIGDDIWMNCDPANMVFNTASQKFSPLPKTLSAHPLFKNAEISNVCPFEDDTYLIQTASDGLFIYDRRSGELIQQNENGFPFPAPDFKVSTIFTDSSKNVWFGGVDQGVAAHYRYLDRFNNDNRLRSLMQGKSVVSACFDNEHNLWMATRSYGLYIYNLGSGAVRNYMPDDVARKDPGKDFYFNFVFADSRGHIWLSLTNSDLLKCSFDRNNGLRVLQRFNVWGAMEITEDSTGTLWVGTASPFVAYLPDGGESFTLLQVFDGQCFIPAIRQISGHSMLVAAFNQPLKRVDIHTREVSLLPVSTSMDTLLKRTVFIPTDVLPEENGNLWIGTVGNGLLHYNAQEQSLSLAAEAACNDISALAKDNSGNLWISTLFGMSRLDSVSGRITNFFESDGIGSNQFYDRSKASSEGNDELVFGGTHGITTFNPDNVTRHVDAPLMFQDLKVHNRIIRPGSDSPIAKSLSLRPDVTLGHNQNSFAISFVAVDFCETPRVTYKYMLEGVDPSWVEASQNHEAAYSNVSAGKYKFRVRLADDDAGDSEISLNVCVRPSPWLSWWAILLYVLAGIGILCFCIYFLLKIKAEREARMAAQHDKEQERRINDMNMRFFANVSHEFRTPLTMISGPIKQLETSDGISESNRQLLSIAQTNVSRMLRLVNQLLDFNKLENDTLRLEVSDTDVATLLRDVSLSFALAAKYKKIEFVTVGLEDNFVIPADADKIVKIHCNLLSNALKFTPKGGRIKISLDAKDTPDGRRIIISVENTGKSIPDDQLEKIFRRYYQLESNNHTKDYTGSGIGLYYARALADLHHGSLKAVKTDFDGACFVLELPASDIYSKDEHIASPNQIDTYPLDDDSVYTEDDVDESSDETNTILVVDDDIQVANYLKVLLSPVYKVTAVFDAESALERLSENRPALIISDVVMPGMNGYELCRRIKSDLNLCHIPVILVTAKASVENQVEGFNAEANGYITKPFDPALLMSLIGSVLRNRDKARQLATTSTSVDGVEPEIMAPQDSAFLAGLYQLMEDELANSELDVNNISRKMMMSRTKFYYKVKGLTGETPSVFFRTYKLNRATELIAERHYTLSEIADRTGFSTLSHFSRSFKKQFGVSPSDYQPEKRE